MEIFIKNTVKGFSYLEKKNFIMKNNLKYLNKNSNLNNYINFIFNKKNSVLINSITSNNNKCNDYSNSFFIIDLNEVIINYNLWTKKLPYIKPHYAIKSNPDLNIIKLLKILGCGFDCASKQEFELLFQNNIINKSEINDLIFSNPCKYNEHIIYAKDNNIPYTTFDSLEELEKINQYNKNIKVLMRIAVDDSKSICKFNSKFGIDYKNELYMKKIFEYCKNNNMNLTGIMFHVGSGCNDSNAYYEAIKTCKNIFNYAKSVYNIDMNMIDIGGGFTLDKFDNHADKINESFNKYFFKYNLHPYIISEPGRFFSETPYNLVSRIFLKRERENIIDYHLNDGIYHNFNCILYDYKIPEFILTNENKHSDELHNSRILGPTCDSLDKIKENILLPKLSIGDFMITDKFGAYTDANAKNFNGFPISNKFYFCTDYIPT